MDAIVAEQLHPTKDQPTRAASAAHREPSDGAISKRARWGARIVSGIPAAFLLFDAALKLAKPPMVVEGTVKLGYPAQVILPLGVVLLLGLWLRDARVRSVFSLAAKRAA